MFRNLRVSDLHIAYSKSAVPAGNIRYPIGNSTWMYIWMYICDNSVCWTYLMIRSFYESGQCKPGSATRREQRLALNSNCFMQIGHFEASAGKFRDNESKFSLQTWNINWFNQKLNVSPRGISSVQNKDKLSEGALKFTSKKRDRQRKIDEETISRFLSLFIYFYLSLSFPL